MLIMNGPEATKKIRELGFRYICCLFLLLCYMQIVSLGIWTFLFLLVCHVNFVSIFCSGPIIGVTANVLEEDKQSFLAHGVNTVLNKPLNLQMFLEAFERFSGRVSVADEGGEEDAVTVAN